MQHNGCDKWDWRKSSSLDAFIYRCRGKETRRERYINKLRTASKKRQKDSEHSHCLKLHKWQDWISFTLKNRLKDLSFIVFVFVSVLADCSTVLSGLVGFFRHICLRGNQFFHFIHIIWMKKGRLSNQSDSKIRITITASQVQIQCIYESMVHTGHVGCLIVQGEKQLRL